MNKVRRQTLSDILRQIEDAKSLLEEVLSEEEDYLYGIPDNLQSSAKYEKAEQACSDLEEAVSGLDDIISYIESAVEQ